MTPRQLGAYLAPRLGHAGFLTLGDQLAGRRVHFPGRRSCRTLVFRSILRRAAQQGWRPSRIVSELRALGLSYSRSYIVQAIGRLGLKRKNPRRVAAGKRSRRSR